MNQVVPPPASAHTARDVNKNNERVHTQARDGPERASPRAEPKTSLCEQPYPHRAYMTQDNTLPGPIFKALSLHGKESAKSRNTHSLDRFSKLDYSTARRVPSPEKGTVGKDLSSSGAVYPKTCRLVARNHIQSLRRNRALRIGQRGVSCRPTHRHTVGTSSPTCRVYTLTACSNERSGRSKQKKNKKTKKQKKKRCAPGWG